VFYVVLEFGDLMLVLFYWGLLLISWIGGLVLLALGDWCVIFLIVLL